MHLDCADCDRFACRAGRLDATPDDCPMRGPFPAFEDLYATDDARRLLYQSARVEADGYGKWTRVQEVAELSRRLGYQRLGIAHCPDMEREAQLAAGALRSEGLTVVVAGSGTDSDPTDFDAVACDPVGQAAFLAARGTQLNVLAGMCVGHDSATMARLRAPAVCLVAKDRVLAHNTVAALYRP